MSYKAKRQIKEIRDREERSEVVLKFALGLTAWLVVTVFVYFVGFLLFGGTVIN